MKTIMTLMVAVMLLGATASFAQPQADDIGIFGDSAGTVTAMPYPFAVVNLYVVLFAPSAGEVKGYEYSLALHPALVPAGVSAYLGDTFDSCTTFPPSAYFCPGGAPAGNHPDDLDGGVNVGVSPLNMIVGLAACTFPEANGNRVLAEVPVATFAPAPDMTVCVGPANPSSFAPASPGYLICQDQNNLVPAGLASNGQNMYPDGCFVFNNTLLPPVATETTSFGAMKAKF